MTNLFDLTGRIAVVTGSAQGMGRAMATALAETGADLVLLDRNEAGNEATAHSIRQLGRKVLPIAGDVTDTDHIDRVFATRPGSGGGGDGAGRYPDHVPQPGDQPLLHLPACGPAHAGAGQG